MERKKLVSIVVMAVLTGAAIIIGILDTVSRFKSLQKLIDDNSLPDSAPETELDFDESEFIGE